MSHRAEHFETCAAPECSASFPASYWDSVRAHDRGWFFQRDGRKFCPEHVPDWVPAWRERQRQLKEGG